MILMQVIRDSHFCLWLSLFNLQLFSLCCQVTSVVSNSVRPHGLQPTRLLCPWDSPGKNTGVGCHFLLQCMKVENESEVAQSCPTLSDPMDCSLPGSSIHGIFQATVLEWGAIAFSQGSYNNLQICFWETIPPTFLIFKFLGLLILSTATRVDRQPKTSQTDLIWSNTTTLLGVIRHKQTKWEGYKPAETYPTFRRWELICKRSQELEKHS